MRAEKQPLEQAYRLPIFDQDNLPEEDISSALSSESHDSAFQISKWIDACQYWPNLDFKYEGWPLKKPYSNINWKSASIPWLAL